MRLQRGKKGIKTGEYFVKKGDVYVVGTAEERGLLSALSYAIGKQDADVYVLIDQNKAHFFDFEKLRYQHLDRSLLEEVLMVYPNAFVLEVGQQTRGKVSKSGVEINRKQVFMSGVLLMVFFSLLIFNNYYKKKKREEEERIRRMQEMARLQAQKQKQVVLPPCTANIDDFMSKYIFPAHIEGSAIVIQSDDTLIKVPLMSRQVPRVGSHIKVYIPSLSSTESKLPDGGIAWQFRDFGDCLEFIYKNRHLPLSVVSLKEDACQINIVGGCLYDQKSF